MCRRGTHQPSASVSQLPSPRMAHLNDSLCICLSLLLPCTRCPLSHPVLRLNSQRASVKGHDPPRPFLIFENFIYTNICQGPYFHLSLNTHSPPAFLLICPSTAHSRKNCLNMQRDLHSHTQVETTFHCFRSCVAVPQLLAHRIPCICVMF